MLISVRHMAEFHINDGGQLLAYKTPNIDTVLTAPDWIINHDYFWAMKDDRRKLLTVYGEEPERPSHIAKLPTSTGMNIQMDLTGLTSLPGPKIVDENTPVNEAVPATVDDVKKAKKQKDGE